MRIEYKLFKDEEECMSDSTQALVKQKQQVDPFR